MPHARQTHDSKPSPSWPRALGLALALMGAPWLLVASALTYLPAPPNGPDPQRCSRACHDRGCPHRAVLPAVLTSDDGLYGATIRQLQVAGRATGLGARRGYGLVNLLLFCALWPLLMLSLALIAIRQRQRIRTLRRRTQSRASKAMA